MKKILISLLLAMTMVFTVALVGCSEESPAYFTHKLTFSVNGTGGTVDFAELELFGETVTYKIDGNKVYAGSKTITATADEGYEFSAWSRANGTYELTDAALELKASFKTAGSEPDSGSQSGEGSSSSGQEPGYQADPDTYYLLGEFLGIDAWVPTAETPTLNNLVEDELNLASRLEEPLPANFKFKIAKGGTEWVEWDQEDATNLSLVDFDVDGNAVIKTFDTYNIYVSKNGKAYLTLTNPAWEADADTYYLVGNIFTFDMWTVTDMSPKFTTLENDEKNYAIYENVLLAEGDKLKVVKGADTWLDWNQEDAGNLAVVDFDADGNAVIKETQLYNLYVSKDGMTYIAKASAEPPVVTTYTVTLKEGAEDEGFAEEYNEGTKITIDGNKVTIFQDEDNYAEVTFTPDDEVHTYFDKFVDEDGNEIKDGEFTLTEDVTIVVIYGAYPEGYYLVGTQTETDWAYADAYKFTALEVNPEVNPNEDIAQLIEVELAANDEVKVRYLNTWISVEESELVTILEGGNAQIKEAGKYNFYINKEGKLYIAKYVAPAVEYTVTIFEGDAVEPTQTLKFLEGTLIKVDGETLTIGEGEGKFENTNTSEAVIVSYKAGESALTGTSTLNGDLAIRIISTEVPEGYFLAGTMSATAWSFDNTYKFGEPVEDPENEVELIEVELAKDAAVKVRHGKAWISVEADDLVTLDDEGNAVIKEDGKYNFYINKEGKAYIAKFIPSYGITILDTFYVEAGEEPTEELDEVLKEGAVIIVDGENICVKKSAEATGNVYENGSLDENYYVTYVLKGETEADDKVLTGTTVLTEDMVIEIVYTPVTKGYFLAGTMSEEAFSFDDTYKFTELAEEEDDIAIFIKVNLAKDTAIKVRHLKSWIAIEANDAIDFDADGNAVIKEDNFYNFYINKEGKAFIEVWVEHYTVSFIDLERGNDLSDKAQNVAEGSYATFVEFVDEDHVVKEWRLEGADVAFDFAATPITADTELYAVWKWAANPECYYLVGKINGQPAVWDVTEETIRLVESEGNLGAAMKVVLKKGDYIKIRNGGEDATEKWYEWASEDPDTKALITVEDMGGGVNAIVQADGTYDIYLAEDGKAYITGEHFNVSFLDIVLVNEVETEVPVATAQSIVTGLKATEPTAPVKDDGIFVKWVYYVEEVATDFDFDTPITADIKLYAVWNNFPQGIYLVGTQTVDAWTFNADYKFTAITAEEAQNKAELIRVALKAEDKVKVRENKIYTPVEANEALITFDDDGNAVILADGHYDFFINKEGKVYIAKSTYTVSFKDGEDKEVATAQVIVEGEKAIQPELKVGDYIVKTWKIKGAEADFNFETAITADTELVISTTKWEASEGAYYIVGKIAELYEGAAKWEVDKEHTRLEAFEGTIGAALNVHFTAGDIIKIRTKDVEVWFQWDMDDATTMSLAEVEDMGGAYNATIKTTGVYDVYLKEYEVEGEKVYKAVITTQHFDVKFLEEVEEGDPITAAATQRIAKGSKATAPEVEKEGYEFVGWYYYELEVAHNFDFDTAITADTVLYADWVKIPENTYYVVGTHTTVDWSVISATLEGCTFEAADEDDLVNAYILRRVTLAKDDEIKVRTATEWFSIEACDLIEIDAETGNAIVKADGDYDFFINKEGKVYIAPAQMKISFYKGDDVISPDVYVDKGSVISTPIVSYPDAGDGYHVTSWKYEVEAEMVAYDFANAIEADLVLYADKIEWLADPDSCYIVGIRGGVKNWEVVEASIRLLAPAEGDEDNIAVIEGIELLAGDVIKVRQGDNKTWFDWDNDNSIVDLEDMGGGINAKIRANGIYNVYLSKDGKAYITADYVKFTLDDVEYDVIKGSNYTIEGDKMIFAGFTVKAEIEKGYAFDNWSRKVDSNYNPYDEDTYLAEQDMVFESIKVEAFTTVNYFNANLDAVYAYVWDKDSGIPYATNAEWPGVAMEPVEGEAGWFSATFSSKFDMIIFNDGTLVAPVEGVNKTADLAIDPDKLTYFDGNWYESIAAAKEEMVEVAVDFYIWFNDYIRTKSLALYYTNGVIFKCDGEKIYANADEFDLMLPEGKYVVIGVNGVAYELNSEIAITRDSLIAIYILEGEDPVPAKFPYLYGEKTVYFYYVGPSADVYAYAWLDGTEPDTVENAVWPGVKMTAVEGKEGWYSYSFEDTIYDMIIFTDNASTKTDDLEIPEENVYFNGDEWISNFPMTVYFYNAEGWENVYAYLMNTLTSTENETYPGEAMTAVEGKDGWFSYTFSGDFTKITFNPGNVAMNGVALPTDEKVYYYDGAWYDDFVTPFTVYFYNNNGIWEEVAAYAYYYDDATINNGEWPGVQMTAVEGHDGWYSYTFPSGLYDKIQFNENLEFGDAFPPFDIPTDENVYCYGIEWISGFPMTVYYYNANGWDNIHAYAWKDGLDFAQNNDWPGDQMTAVEGHDGWYSYTFIEGAFENIIFNNGNSGEGNQTADLVIDTDNLYYKGGAWQADFVSTYTVTIVIRYYDVLEQEVTNESLIQQDVDEGAVVTVDYDIDQGECLIRIGTDMLYDSNDNVEWVSNVSNTGDITVDDDLEITVTVEVDF